MDQKQIDEIQASVNEAIQQARRKVEELLTAIDGALAVGTFVDLGETRSEAERALSSLPKKAPKLYDPALVLTCQMAGGRSYRGGSKEDRLRFAQVFADACTKIIGGPSVVVREVWDEHWVEYGDSDGDDNHPLNDMNDAQRDLFDAALTQKGLIVEE